LPRTHSYHCLRNLCIANSMEGEKERHPLREVRRYQ
jgi:hypothetical protein